MASNSSQKIGNENIRYVNAELVKEDGSDDVLQLETSGDEYNVNVAYANDGHTIYVQQGQYMIPVGGHAMVLQDDQRDFEYIINNIVADEELQDANETEQTVGVGQSVIYYASEFAHQSQIFEEDQDVSETNDGIDESMVEENSMHTVIPLSKRIKLEQNYIDEYQRNQGSYGIENNFVQIEEEVGSDKIIIAPDSDDGQLQQSQYQYAILKNGKLHLQTLDFVDTTTDSQFNMEDKDQNQQLQEQLAAFQQSINMDDTSLSTSTVDLEKITGKNLITGQTVTLDSYFDKLQRRLATVDVADQCFTYNAKKQRRNDLLREQGNLSKNVNTDTPTVDGSLINKKIVVGKTTNGKKIVGKILSVHMTAGGSSTGEEYGEVTKEVFPKEIKQKNADALPRTVSEEVTLTTSTKKNTNSEPTAVIKSSHNELSADWSNGSDETPQEQEQQPQLLQPHIIIKKHVVTRENFDYSIGKTLAGLMGLETVQRRLQNKNLVVKLIEKVFDHSMDAFNKTVSYVYGHMELVKLEKEDPDNRQWAFVLHNENNSSPPIDDSENASEDVVSGSVEAEVSSKEKNNKEETLPSPKIHQSKDIEEIHDDVDDDDEDDVEEIKDISLEMEEDTWAKYNETTSLTIVITVDKSGKKSTRVNLSPHHPATRCPICSKEYKSPLQMRKHLNNVHLCEKSAKCHLCGKNFANQTILQRHQKIHTGERWFQCLKCSKSFNTAGSLKRHLTVHDPSLRPLECSVCVQRFTDESSLRKHLLIHTGIRAHVCEVCNRAFVNQGDLNFHRRIHDPVKQFSCEVCGREFSRHSNLMRHAEIHRGVGALHRCEICGCSYSFVSSLTRHIVQKHIGQQQQQQ